MNLFDVHSQKSPVDGTVLKKVYRPGKYFDASLDKASAENEQCRRSRGAGGMMETS